MKTINIKGKEYITVNERLKEFRTRHPQYSLRTDLVSVDAEQALVRAVIRDENDRVLAEGVSYERRDKKGSLVNSTSHVENAETSAWGRALGNLGIGIDTAVASADEMQTKLTKQEPKQVAQGTKTPITVSGMVPLPPSKVKVMETLNNAVAIAPLDQLYTQATTKYSWSAEDRKSIDETYQNRKTFLSTPQA